ncbi:MAG: 50S ribosomal protein L3 [Conexivisphaerales archaeon]
MGHRKHSAPRRGSLAFAPRSRAKSLLPRVRTWAKPATKGEPSLAGFIAFKAGMLHLVTVDDREKTPNFGKPLFIPATVLSVPAVRVYGVRAYSSADGESFALKDVYDPSFELFSKSKKKKQDVNADLTKLKELASDITEIRVLAAVYPKEVGLSQKKPILYEIPVLGADMVKNIDYAAQLLGKNVQPHKSLSAGTFVDVAAVTKGKGFEGPVTRFGVKRKQHKSRKSVRAVGVLSPWHPHDVMYTVPRAGQMGFHQRVEYNHKVMIAGSEESNPITPAGGFMHFGRLKGDYIVVNGSVPGTAKRPVVVRLPVRPKGKQVKPPQVIFTSTKAVASQ